MLADQGRQTGHALFFLSDGGSVDKQGPSIAASGAVSDALLTLRTPVQEAPAKTAVQKLDKR